MRPQKILMVKLKHLGDVLMATPLVRALKDAWPGAEITFVVNPGTEEMLTHNPAISRVLLLERFKGSPWPVRLWREAAFPVGLRKERFDLAIELGGGDRGALVCFLSRAKRRLGYLPKKKGTWGRRLLFTDLVDADVTRYHSANYNLLMAEKLGIAAGEPNLEFYYSREHLQSVCGLLGYAGLKIDEPYAVAHPTSRWLFKCWTAKNNAEVIDYLQRELAIPVVLTAAPDLRELEFAREVAARCAIKPLDLTGRLTLKELGALTHRARLFFGVDSAPMHLASALGTPCVVLFGPSGEHMWGPLGSAGRVVVSRDHECRPCGQDGCEGTKVSECLYSIPAPRVIEEIEGLAQTGFSRSSLGYNPLAAPAEG